MAAIEKVFKAALGMDASDVHIVPGEPFIVRRYGELTKMKNKPVAPEQCKQIILEILTPAQRKRLSKMRQLDFAVNFSELGRFRGSAMLHNNGLSAAFRRRKWSSRRRWVMYASGARARREKRWR